MDEWNHVSKKLIKACPEKDAGGFFEHGGKKNVKLEAQKERIDLEYSELAARTAQGVNLHMATIAEALPAVVRALDFDQFDFGQRPKLFWPKSKLVEVDLAEVKLAEVELTNRKLQLQL